MASEPPRDEHEATPHPRSQAWRAWARRVRDAPVPLQLGIGWALLLAGVAMLILPGPGLLSIAAGLALLSRHHTQARRILDYLKSKLPERLRAHDSERK